MSEAVVLERADHADPEEAEAKVETEEDIRR
jgi:hypothetical protein